jgi:hypothetical protein
MSRTITIGQIGDYAQEQTEKLLRHVVFETDSLLKQASPVDTGRFRFSWQIGENATGAYDAGPQQPSNPLSRQLTKPPREPMTASPRGLNYTPTYEKLGNVYSVHNSLPYAEKLADGIIGKGGSTQAPAGWIDNIANDIRTRARDAAERIGRES